MGKHQEAFYELLAARSNPAPTKRRGAFAEFEDRMKRELAEAGEYPVDANGEPLANPRTFRGAQSAERRAKPRPSARAAAVTQYRRDLADHLAATAPGVISYPHKKAKESYKAGMVGAAQERRVQRRELYARFPDVPQWKLDTMSIADLVHLHRERGLSTPQIAEYISQMEDDEHYTGGFHDEPIYRTKKQVQQDMARAGEAARAKIALRTAMLEEASRATPHRMNPAPERMNPAEMAAAKAKIQALLDGGMSHADVREKYNLSYPKYMAILRSGRKAKAPRIPGSKPTPKGTAHLLYNPFSR